MPCSSPRNSGWRATDWIMEPKMFPMPMPAPSEPSPMPSARPIAFPALVTSPDVAARSVCTSPPSLVLRLDRRADVDGGQGGEDERLDRDDDPNLECVENPGERHERDQDVALDDEDQPEEREDQHVAGEHVGEETNAQRDQSHELPEDLDDGNRHEERARNFRDPTLEVANRAVPANAFVMREDEGEQRERERDVDRGGRGVDPPDRNAMVRLAGQRQRDEAEHVHDPDEEEQARDVREPEADRLRW